MRTYPAIDITWPASPSDDDVEQLMAALDDHGPTAVEEQPGGVRVFFGGLADRDAAAATTHDVLPGVTVTPLLVPDDNWAERSQAALRPVRVDRVIVAPPWTLEEVRGSGAAAGDGPIIIAIQPSMGFGTGHHQSTRLCLKLLQRHPATGASVLDVGTGSGVLAIAAWKLGAANALGIDVDRDALTAAAENVEMNHSGQSVTLELADITQGTGTLAGRFDLVFANITGAMLQRHAAAVASALAPGGLLISSGFQAHELDDVTAAFAATGLERIDDAEEDTWMAAAFR
ncbi:MAG: 50S ribosomal protein L11 methyltransferase [Acidobacteria bacterium]|nr:50S ribosomal protein L11 methyltransferase [Acidobacteriota bacterium]